ncbi:MAG: hypothetical protein WC871_08210 [Bacteroidales bacterium]|jgi:hypothetical protein
MRIDIRNPVVWQKIRSSSSETALNEDESTKSGGSSSETGLNEDESTKSGGSSSKTALNEDGWQKIRSSSSETALNEDESTKSGGSSSKTALNEDERQRKSLWQVERPLHIKKCVKYRTVEATNRKPLANTRGFLLVVPPVTELPNLD